MKTEPTYFVYMLRSETRDVLYKGHSVQPFHRLREHINRECQYTADKGPWKMVYLEKFTSKTAALKRERQLKRQNRKYLDWLITQPSNLLNRKFDFG